MKTGVKAAIAIAAGLGVAFGAHAGTVCVAEQTETSVTLAINDNLEQELYIAHGTTDGGEDKYAWDSFEKVADIAFGQTSYTYEVPSALRDGRPMRFFLVQKFGVDMAKELTSITSTGAQWINTGTAAANNWSMDFRFRTGASLPNDTTFFGQSWGGNQYLFILQNDSGTKFRFYGASPQTVSTPQANTDYRLVIDPASMLTITGGGSETRKSVNRSVSGNVFGIFGDTGGNHRGSWTFYSMKIGSGVTKVRDFIPAVNADGDIGLYDQVNNVFYKNQMTTPFVAGEERPADRFGRVTGTTPAVRFRRAVSIASATADAVSLAFSNPDGAAYKLYVGYGAADCGSRKNAWDNFEEIATIAADATTYEYTLPAALKTDGVFYRFFLVKTDDLPYASEIASITSTGAQTVRLDYVPGAETAVDFRCGDVTYEHQKTFFGQGWTGNCYLFNMQYDSFRFHGSGKIFDGIVPAANTDYRCRIMANGKCVLDNGAATSVITENLQSYPYSELCVFASYGCGYPAKFRFDSMTVTDGGMVVRDLVPVQTAAGKGALFDRVSGTVFENPSGTDFTKGAAAARQGWVVAMTEPATPAATLERITLGTDTDWSAIEGRLLAGATVNLNGYELHIADYVAFSSKGVIFDGTGSVRLSVAESKTLTLASSDKLVFSGGLVKDGPGTLVIASPMPDLSGVTVEAGIMKYGAQSVIANGITVKVLDGAAFDMNGSGNGNVPIYDIAGTGPDGKGALRNTGADVTAGSAQMKGLRLSANATVGGTANFGQINSSYNTPTCFDLNGYTLTIDIPSNKGFWLASANSSSPGTIYLKQGILYPYKKDKEMSLPNVDVIVDGTGASYRIPNDGSKKVTFKSITALNGGQIEEQENRTYIKELTLLDGALVPSYVKWIYVANEVVVSNETTDVTIHPPIAVNGTSAKLLKYGAGTFYIKNNHTDQQMNSGVEIFGGTVVMDSTASTPKPEIAISAAAVPVTIHAGGTLDMRLCTSAPFKVTKMTIDEGGTLLHTADSKLSIAGAATYEKPMPFGTFTGSLDIAAVVTFDLTELYAGASAPAVGTDVTLLAAGSINRANGGGVVITGCPYDSYVTFEANRVVMHTLASSSSAHNPIKIWNVGGSFVYGANGYCYRASLGEALLQEGWNVQMTGWRTANASQLCAGNEAWKRHAGAVDLALKTSATRAGLLEGLETYCAAANEPDFTVLLCGDRDAADGVADATILANYKAAVTRIKAALPMTTVIACTIPGGSQQLNADIAAWCAAEADVECADVASAITTAQTPEECDAVAAAIKAKLVTLATADGKINPSTWTRPTVTLGAENNVPAEYLEGFTRVRSIEPTDTTAYAQNLYTIPYAYAPPMQETGIVKAGYYIELVRKDTGALQAMWIDMDAPGSTWADVALPVTVAQQKQQTVTKLHVWSNFGGVRQVPANDDSVSGYIEFNCLNYSGTDRAGDVVGEPWSGNVLGFNDTFGTSGNFACFQIMRKFSESGAFPAAEILFAYNRWGGADSCAIGMGTLANYGNLGQGDKTLDWTFLDKVGSADMANISGAAYSFVRIDFWVKYAEAPTRESMAKFVWTGATDSTFATVGNWAKGETVATSLANANILLPENANPTFAYIGWDPVNLSSTTFMVDGTATFPEVGGFYFAGLDMGQAGKLVYDPVKFSIRLVSPPIFASGAKIALTPNYASATKGRFLLMTWDNGSLDMDAASLNALFDTASADGADVKVWAENLEHGGRLWLDLDYAAPTKRVNVLCTGDSITQGSDSTYGNWRVFLMKRLAAAGYAPVAKGHWKVESNDICGAVMPEEWVWHSGISGQRLVTKGGGGTIDAIEAMLDCAGDVDFVLAKICTNDINSNGSTAEELFPVWTNLVWKTLRQKPHAKFIAGAVVDIAYDAAKDAKVVAFNTAMKNAIKGGMFPAKRAYFADLYTPCYRYDADGNYITGSFYANNNLHPDWPGEDKMAATYCAAIEAALADDSGFQPGAADTDVPTTSGIENNVPAEYLAGMTRARVFDIAANGGTTLASTAEVPYAFVDPAAPTINLTRVGYYIELRRKDTALDDYHDLTRWIWVSMDAFGSRTLDDVGIPLTTINQCVVNRLRVKTNMPGIEATSATESGVRGWVEFWPGQYNVDASGLSDAPANTFRCDWNDIRSNNMTGYGSMQVHRFTPGEANPAQVMFAFNRWTSTDCYEIGIGNFSHNGKAIDQTWMGDANTRERNTSLAYEVARIEIWTAADAAADAAFVLIDGISADGNNATVTGEVVNFGEGATSATLTLEWSTDPTFATVAGSAAVGEVTEPGEVTATATGLTAGETWYFRFTSVNSANVSGATGASDPLELNAGVWRPQAAGDVWTSIAWQKNGEGPAVAFNPAWTALFDGNEATKVATVQLPEVVSARDVMVDASADYTLAGTGAINSSKLVKSGSGTLTLEAAVLSETPDIEIRGGTVKLGDSAAQGAAGRVNGTITVKNGGQFDFNHIETASGNNRTRANITSGKTFVIEGEGPDGSGALTTTAQNEYWGSPINEVIMTGDATIGGVSRIDIRGNSKNSITGPADATLTIKNSAANRTRGLNVHGPISVGKMVIAEEGCYCPEGGSFTLNIPNGIELHGAFSMWAATGAWNVGGMVAVGDRAYIGNDSGTGYIRTPLTVSEGATLTMGGGHTTYYMETVTNRGEITVANGNHYIYGSLVNEGNPVIRTGRAMYIYPPLVQGDSRLVISGGQTYTSGSSDWGDYALDISLTGGGSFVFGTNNDGYGMPKFGKDKVTITAASGHTGTVFFHPAISASIDGLACSGTISKFFMQGPGSSAKDRGPIIDGQANNLVFSANNLEIGNGNGRGDWTVTGADTHIAVKGLYANWIGSDYYAGSLTFRDGLLEIGSDGIKEAFTTPERTAFNMENGTLRASDNFNIGKAGMRATFGSPAKGGKVTFDLNGKTVKWGTGLMGASDVTLTGAGTFTLDRPGIQGIPLGKWTIDATGATDLRNAAGFAGGLSLAENATATLDIAGESMVEFLAWTWSGNAWNVMQPKYLEDVVITPFVATSLTYLNRKASALSDVKYGNGSGFNYFGEFYVSAEQAGTWYFSHSGVVHNGLQIDDTELDRAGKNTTTEKTISLTEGWHKFMISIYCDAANQTIGPRNNGTESYTFKAPGDSAYRPFDTTTLPMRMRQHLGARTSVRWRKFINPASNLGIYDKIDESKYVAMDTVTNSLQIMHVKYSSGTNAPLGGACTRFDGYFKVEPGQEGFWTFQGNFDDQISLDVDGRRLFKVTANCGTASGSMSLRAGWHKFDIRIGDNSSTTSGGTGGGLTDADGNVCALKFKVNGGAYHAFDERYLPIAYTPGDAQKFEKPGLGGVTELAAGSTLVNAPREGGWCPVYGTLKGAGTLSGPFRFTGEDNCWEVAGNSSLVKLNGAVTFDNADANALAGLKSVKATFNRKPGRSEYEISDALGITSETVAGIGLAVTDEKGNDYSEDFALMVKGGKLKLVNSNPGGMIILFR
ncbi:MAG: SGNH/GDSL hydrolase family protein [Kiritimatiellae bacterium]|nr:SGNH/GDSL hydrolase family protein [Kiritimatiellia bacterium]